MGKTKLPSVSFKMTTKDFQYLVRALRDAMNYLIEDVDDDPHERSLYEHNYYLVRSWIALCETEAHQLTVHIDLMYAKHFVEYFKVTELRGNYENVLLGRVISALDTGIINIEHKRKYSL